jgi:hypothetical protein
MGNYFSSSKNESIQIINETDNDHIIVTNSKDGETIEKKNEQIIKTEETTLSTSISCLSDTLNENEDGKYAVTVDPSLNNNNNCVIQKKNLKRKNKKKNKKKYHLQ